MALRPVFDPEFPMGTLEDDLFYYVPVEDTGDPGADYVYLPPNISGLGNLGGLFSKIAKKVKKVVKKAGSAVKKVAKKVAEPVKKVAKKVGKVAKSAGEIALDMAKSMVGLGVPLPVATDLAAGIGSGVDLTGLSQAQVDEMARQAAAKYQARGGRMEWVKPVAISLAAAGGGVALLLLLGAALRGRGGK